MYTVWRYKTMPMSDFLTFIEPCHNTGSFSSTGSSTPQSTSNVPLKFFVHRSIFATITPCGNVNVLTMGNKPLKEVPSTLFQSTCTCVKSNKQQKIRRRGGGNKIPDWSFKDATNNLNNTSWYQYAPQRVSVLQRFWPRRQRSTRSSTNQYRPPTFLASPPLRDGVFGELREPVCLDAAMCKACLQRPGAPPLPKTAVRGCVGVVVVVNEGMQRDI